MIITPPIKNIKELTEPLKEEILKGDVHTIEEMKTWLEGINIYMKPISIRKYDSMV